MLLAQPFDPFKEQQRKKPSFGPCQLISRTKRALGKIKNKMHNRQFQTVMMPDHRFMLNSAMAQPQPPPSLWPTCCYGCCYGPYMSPLMPPPPHLPPHLSHFPPHQMPYTVCIHVLPPPPPPQQPMYYNSKSHNNDDFSITDSTLYSSNSSMYSGKEKELLEEAEERDEQMIPNQHHRSMSGIQRSNSERMGSEKMPRPSLSRRSTYYYN